MKKLILLLLFIPLVFSCDKEGVNDPLIYSIEGKWVWSPSENRTDANTMYEFVDGVRYTYYCITCPGDDAYWNSLDTSDALPATNPYTFENDTLRVDLNFGNELVTQVTFECDGGKLLMDGQFSHLWRLSSDCD
jgi:hypothetical protein